MLASEAVWKREFEFGWIFLIVLEINGAKYLNLKSSETGKALQWLWANEERGDKTGTSKGNKTGCLRRGRASTTSSEPEDQPLGNTKHGYICNALEKRNS